MDASELADRLLGPAWCGLRPALRESCADADGHCTGSCVPEATRCAGCAGRGYVRETGRVCQACGGDGSGKLA